MRHFQCFRSLVCVAASLALIAAVETAVAQQAAPASPAPASQAPKAAAPKADPKKQPPSNASEAIIANARAVTLTGLTLTNSAGKAVATQKTKVAPGKRATLKIPAKSGCIFVVSVAFEDGAEFDETELNLCTDKLIRFTEGTGE